jgi:hypothetical protein
LKGGFKMRVSPRDLQLADIVDETLNGCIWIKRER